MIRTTCGGTAGTSREGRGLRTFLLPIRPARCDHLKFRLTGKGEMKLFSLARVLEAGSDA